MLSRAVFKHLFQLRLRRRSYPPVSGVGTVLPWPGGDGEDHLHFPNREEVISQYSVFNSGKIILIYVLIYLSIYLFIPSQKTGGN